MFYDLDNTLKDWFTNLPEPEALNIGAKQAHLKRKLRWEKMTTSNEKIKQLKGIFKKLKIRGKK